MLRGKRLVRNWPGLFVCATIIAFLFLKLKFLTFHFGDGNAYVYMASRIISGEIPYRDFFLADPPFMLYILAFFKTIFGEKLILFQIIPLIFEAGSAILVYLLLRNWNIRLAFLAPLFYLFSFSVLSTSDYLTGVQLVSFLMLLGIFLWDRQKSFWSGFSWSLAILVKLYAVFGLLGFLIFILQKGNLRKMRNFFLGGFLGGIIFLLPFLVISFGNVWQYLVVHQLNRPPGISKGQILAFYLKREWFFIVGGIVGGLAVRRKIILFPLIFLVAFFIFFQDLYYLYLNSFFFMLVILSALFLDWLWEDAETRGIGKVVLGVSVLYLLVSLGYYQTGFSEKGEFKNAQEISAYVSDLPEDYDLYGSHEVAPLIALETDKKLLGNYIDTNGQAFASGGQNLKEASQMACEKGAYFLAKIIDAPDQDVRDFGFDAYFNRDIFDSCCHRIKDFPDTSSTDPNNKIAIYECKKQTPP